MTEILLCGANGKMGRVVRECAEGQADLHIAAGIDRFPGPRNDSFPVYETLREFTGKADVIVDFSHPSLLSDLLEYACRTRTPVVLATTGYSQEQIAQIRRTAEEVAIFFTFNMSLGINLLQDLARRAATVLGEQFDIEIVEKHHNQKIDAPSGTALMLADSINDACGERYHYEYDRHSKRHKRAGNEIGIHSIRGGTIVGEHEVIFAGRDEILTISHTAMSKSIFAVGALNAARFLAGRPAGLYQMSDLLADA